MKGRINSVKKANGKTYYYLRDMPISLYPLRYYKGKAFETKEEAQEVRKELNRNLKYQQPNQPTKDFNKVALEYLNGKPIRYSTKYKLIEQYERHIAPFFVNKTFKSITRGYIQEVVYQLPQWSINILRQVLRYLYRTERIDKDIWSLIHIPRRLKDDDKIALTKEQVQEHLNLIRKRRLYHIVLLMYFTGIRIGEACTLLWDEIEIVNDTEGYIYVNSTATETEIGVARGKPKTPSSKRKVYFYNKELVDALRLAKENSKGHKWVAENRSGTSFTTPNSLRWSYFTSLREQLQLPISCHTTRRTYISHCLLKGINMKEIERQVGHTNSKMIINVYSKSIQKVEDEYKGIKLYL